MSHNKFRLNPNSDADKIDPNLSDVLRVPLYYGNQLCVLHDLAGMDPTDFAQLTVTTSGTDTVQEIHVAATLNKVPLPIQLHHGGTGPNNKQFRNRLGFRAPLSELDFERLDSGYWTVDLTPSQIDSPRVIEEMLHLVGINVLKHMNEGKVTYQGVDRPE